MPTPGRAGLGAWGSTAHPGRGQNPEPLPLQGALEAGEVAAWASQGAPTWPPPSFFLGVSLSLAFPVKSFL